jgi:signal transduction histidine kinase
MTFAFTLVIALLVLSTCGALLEYARTRAESEKAELLRSTARNFIAEVGGAGRKGALQEMDEEDAILRSRGILLVLRDAKRREIAEVGSHRASTHRTPGQRVRSVSLGADRAVFSLSWADEERNLTRQAAALTVLGTIIVLAAGIGAWALVGHTLSPIRSLSRQAKAASAETLSVTLQPSSKDAEVVELVSTLNGLIGRLSEEAEVRGRFYAAASHELRTPLQALLGHLELGISRERTPAEYRAVIEEARQQSDRLIALTRDLLFLNRLQTGAAPAPEPVDIADVCARAVRLVCAEAQAETLRVAVESPECAPIEAPPTHTEMLFRNLIENAVKYARPGTEVRIRVLAAPPSLDVWNEAAGETIPDTTRLFEPFYRPDASRSAETGGNGLGLAICKAIADTDGWNLRLDASASGFHAEAIRTDGPGA